ncbi:MAG: hypothetical protein L6Q95_04055 [Planctomycetes bacterium]|nr:hypothetical protein [Planctomycetota bacterium]
MALSRRARLVRFAGIACIAAALFPSYHGALPLAAGNTVKGLPSADIRLGLPFSPLYRTYRSVDPPPPTPEDGSQNGTSWFFSTVYGWRMEPFSWSAALGIAGAALLFVALRRRREPG